MSLWRGDADELQGFAGALLGGFVALDTLIITVMSMPPQYGDVALWVLPLPFLLIGVLLGYRVGAARPVFGTRAGPFVYFGEGPKGRT